MAAYDAVAVANERAAEAEARLRTAEVARAALQEQLDAAAGIGKVHRGEALVGRRRAGEGGSCGEEWGGVGRTAKGSLWHRLASQVPPPV
jgi:hypothetical protein